MEPPDKCSDGRDKEEDHPNSEHHVKSSSDHLRVIHVDSRQNCTHDYADNNRQEIHSKITPPKITGSHALVNRQPIFEHQLG